MLGSSGFHFTEQQIHQVMAGAVASEEGMVDCVAFVPMAVTALVQPVEKLLPPPSELMAIPRGSPILLSTRRDSPIIAKVTSWLDGNKGLMRRAGEPRSPSAEILEGLVKCKKSGAVLCECGQPNCTCWMTVLDQIVFNEGGEDLERSLPEPTTRSAHMDDSPARPSAAQVLTSGAEINPESSEEEICRWVDTRPGFEDLHLGARFKEEGFAIHAAFITLSEADMMDILGLKSGHARAMAMYIGRLSR